VFGAVVDRYGVLLLRPHLVHVGTRLAPNPVSSVGGILLVAIGVFIVTAAAVRHRRYAAWWNHIYGRGASFGPWLTFPFAVGVALSGLVVMAALSVFVMR